MLKKSFFVLASTVIFYFFSGYLNENIPEDALLYTEEIIKKHGYPVESHSVNTEDGYILNIFRIPRGVKNEEENTKRIPILLMHGFSCSSIDWVINGPKHGLAYYLVDNGFDVWLGNARGNFYSRQHINLDIDSKEFWNFSWHEIGIYDLPATINHILKITGNKKMHYIGHSQGTTAFFVMTSEKPEMNNKILTMQALAPVAFNSKSITPLITLWPYWRTVEEYSEKFGIFQLLPKSKWRTTLSNYVCQNEILSRLCQSVYFELIIGPSTKFYDKKMLLIYMSHMPAGVSIKQYIHFLQMVESKKFRKYDFGKDKNLEVYNAEEPPEYDLDKMTSPIALHYSDTDWFTNIEDVKQLYLNLKNPIGLFKINEFDFNHMDFIWGKNVHKVFYNKVMYLLTNKQ